MTKRSSKRWQNFERDRVLNGLVSGKRTDEIGGNANGSNALLNGKRGPARDAVVPDVRQEPLNGSTGSRLETDDRRAIERGEDEGMSLGRK